MNEVPWHRRAWLLDRLRELAYRLLEPRGLAFVSTLAVTLYKFVQTGTVPEGAVNLLLVTGGIYTGAWLGSKWTELKANGPTKPA